MGRRGKAIEMVASGQGFLADKHQPNHRDLEANTPTRQPLRPWPYAAQGDGYFQSEPDNRRDI